MWSWPETLSCCGEMGHCQWNRGRPGRIDSLSFSPNDSFALTGTSLFLSVPLFSYPFQPLFPVIHWLKVCFKTLSVFYSSASQLLQGLENVRSAYALSQRFWRELKQEGPSECLETKMSIISAKTVTKISAGRISLKN